MTRWWSQYTHKGIYKDTSRIKCNLCTQHNGWLDGSNYYKAANNHYNKFHSELKPEGISNTGTIIGTVSANVANRAKRLRNGSSSTGSTAQTAQGQLNSLAGQLNSLNSLNGHVTKDLHKNEKQMNGNGKYDLSRMSLNFPTSLSINVSTSENVNNTCSQGGGQMSAPATPLNLLQSSISSLNLSDAQGASMSNNADHFKMLTKLLEQNANNNKNTNTNTNNTNLLQNFLNNFSNQNKNQNNNETLLALRDCDGHKNENKIKTTKESVKIERIEKIENQKVQNLTENGDKNKDQKDQKDELRSSELIGEGLLRDFGWG